MWNFHVMEHDLLWQWCDDHCWQLSEPWEEVLKFNYHMRRQEVPVKECMAPSLDVSTCPVVNIIPYAEQQKPLSLPHLVLAEIT